MGGFLDIQVKTRKNGRDGSWFRDIEGRRVGTSARLNGANQQTITNAEQMVWLANYYIELQQEQLDAGIGSDGAPMPALSGGSFARFSHTSGRARFVERAYRGYQGQKVNLGLSPRRDLYGPGKDGHMRDDIRISYVDDQLAKVSITRRSSRIKALANERRAPWWGLTQENARKFAIAQATIFGGAMEDYLDRLGLVQGGDYIVKLARLLNSRKSALRRLAA